MEVISSEQRLKTISRATVILPEKNQLVQGLFSGYLGNDSKPSPLNMPSHDSRKKATKTPLVT